MAVSKELEYVFEKAKQLLDEKEKVYGCSWRENGKNVCIAETFRKAHYVRVQWEKNRIGTDKLKEDLLDLVNWAAFSICLLEEETEK